MNKNNGFKKTYDQLLLITKEYKTSFMGLGVVTCLVLYWTNQINDVQFSSGVGLLTSVGFFLSKDAA
jgi:hypothetical protein